MSKTIKALLVLSFITVTCWAYLFGEYMGTITVIGRSAGVIGSSVGRSSGGTTSIGSSSKPVSVDTSKIDTSSGAVDTSSIDLGFFDDGDAGSSGDTTATTTSLSDSGTSGGGSSTTTETATPLPVMSGYEQASFDATVAQLEQNYGLDSGEAKEVAVTYYFGEDNDDDWLGDSSCPAMSKDLAPIIQDVTGEPAMDAYGRAAYEQDIIHYANYYQVDQEVAEEAIDLYLSGHMSGDVWIEKDPVDGEFKEDYLEVGPETGVGYPICPIMSNDIEPYLNYVVGAGPKPAAPTSEDIERIEAGQSAESVIDLGDKADEIIIISAENTPEEKEKVYSALALTVYDRGGSTNGGSSNGGSSSSGSSGSSSSSGAVDTSSIDLGFFDDDVAGSSGSTTTNRSSSTYSGSSSNYNELIKNVDTNDIKEYREIINEVDHRYRLGTNNTTAVLARHIANERETNPNYELSEEKDIIGSIEANKDTSELIETVRETKTGGVSPTVADLNGDGKINLTDLAILMSFWKKDPSGANSSRSPDMNQDGKVNLTDSAIMMSYWNYAFK